MKKLLNITTIILCVAFVAVSCSKDNIGSKYSDNNPANFSLTGSTSVSQALSIEDEGCDMTLSEVVVTRPSSQGEVTLNFVTSVSGAGSITVDPLVFKGGENSKSPVAHISGVPQGATTTFTVSLPGTDVKAAQGIQGKKTSFTIKVSRKKPASWVEVTTVSVFKNGLFGMFGSCDPDGGTYADYLTYKVKVEKDSESNLFRVKNITKSENCPLFETTDDIEGDMYFEINATDPDFVEVERVGLKVMLNSSYGEQWAGTNYGAFSSKYKVGGTYDASTGIIKWDSGQMFCDMPGYASYLEGSFWDAYSTILWLNEDNMGDDFNRDYKFSAMLEDLYFNNAAFEQTDLKSIYKGSAKDASKEAQLAEKYGTVYSVPSYLVDGYDVFFNVNKKGKLALPESYQKQELGVEILAGVKAYMAIEDVVVGEDIAINTISYDIVDENGNVLGADYTDQFMQFGDESDLKLYEGEYTCEALSNVVTIANVDDSLFISGISKYGAFKFVPDENTYIPSFVGGLINEESNIYAYIGYGNKFYTAYNDVFNYRRLADGSLLPVLTDLAVSNGITDILVLQYSGGWKLGGRYTFGTLKLNPVVDKGVQAAKKVNKNGVSKGEPTFNGKSVVVNSKSVRKTVLGKASSLRAEISK